MISRLLVTGLILAIPGVGSADEPTVRVEASQLQGSRAVEKQTQTAVIRDYLQSWKSFEAALYGNRAELLDADFVGTAREKLGNTIEEQAKLGVHTRYQDRTHDLQIVFYSPEGLSLEMIDTVEYDQQVFDHDKMLATKRLRTRYVVVLTPSEVRWKVRIFQAGGGSSDPL